MIRLLSKLVTEIPGITPLPMPDYMNVHSAWMFGMNIDSDAFDCTADAFAEELSAAGIPGVGTGRYYLMPVAATFLQKSAGARQYPYCMPPASRQYEYGEGTCPQAWQFLQTWIRWATFGEKYTDEHCALAASLIRAVADKHRR